MTSHWYWTWFAIACLVCAAVPAVAWWEDRQDARDREVWATVPGATR